MTSPWACPSEWQHDLYSCPRWLKLLADSGRAAAFEISTPSARLPVHITSPTGNPRYAPANLLRGLTPRAPAMWVAGPMSGYRTDPQRRSPDGDGAALDAAFGSAADLAARSGCGMVAPFLPSELVPTPAIGGLLLFEENEYWLRPAPSFDEYLAPFSPHHRTARRRELRAFEESGARLVVVPLAEQVEKFAALTVADSARRGEAADLAAMTSFLHQISTEFGADALLIGAYLDRGLVGGVLGLRHGGVLWLRMTGFGPALQGTYAYFVLTYYAASLLHDDLVVDDVHLGVGAQEAKQRRGARSAPLFSWVSLPEPPSAAAVQRAMADRAAQAAPVRWPAGWGPDLGESGVPACPR